MYRYRWTIIISHQSSIWSTTGSVLGARLYPMYSRTLSDIVNKHQFFFHSYADDIQIYLHCDNIKSIYRNLWTFGSPVSLIYVTGWQTMHWNWTYIDEQILQVEGTCVKESTHVKILGVTFDQKLTLHKHITNTCRAANMHIRRINSIRQYLLEDVIKTLVQSVLIVCLDYCNALLVSLLMKSLNRLQLTHNTVPRLISRNLAIHT